MNSRAPTAALDGLPGAPDGAGRGVGTAFAGAVESGVLDLPLPGRGQTWERWAALAKLAEQDLCLARLAEGHADAVAILAELGAGPPPAGTR